MTLDRRRFLLAAPAGPALAAAAGARPARAAEALIGTALDAAAFGVVPDAAHDQGEVLQAAIDAAAERRITLALPPGTIATRGLTLRPGSRIVGVGPATRLTLLDTGSLLQARGTSDLRVSDLTLDGRAPRASDREPAVFDLADCERAAVERLEIASGPGNGIALARVSGSVAGCRVSGAGASAIFAIDSTGLEIVHNEVEDCADNGILVWRSNAGSDGTIVAHNRIRAIANASGGSGEYGNGINVFKAGGVIVAGNQIEDCAYSAVRSNSGSDCQIVHNSCRGLGEVAIYAEFAFEGAVIAGNIVDGAATGVAITNFNDGGRLAVCSGNIIRNLHLRDHEDARGNGITAEADTVITGNVVENAPSAGISLGWGPHLRDVQASNNVLRGCGVGIAVSVVEGVGSALISGNLIASPRGNAIQGFEWARPVGGDLIAGGDVPPGDLLISGNLRS